MNVSIHKEHEEIFYFGWRSCKVFRPSLSVGQVYDSHCNIPLLTFLKICEATNCNLSNETETISKNLRHFKA